MFTIILTFVSFVCVILAALCGYLFAVVKNRQNVQTMTPAPAPVTPWPEARPVEAAPVIVSTPKPEPKTTPKTSRSEKPVAPVASSPAPTAKPEPKKRVNNTPVKADVQAVIDSIVNCGDITDTLKREAANFKLIFSIPEVRNAAISWSMPDEKHVLMEARDVNGKTWAQKEDIKNGGRRVTCTEGGMTTTFKSVGALLAYLNNEITLEEASRGKATKSTPKADTPAPVAAPVANEPAPAPAPAKKKDRKTAPKNTPVNDTPAPVAETTPEPAPVANEPKNDTPAPVKKNDILAAIKDKISNGFTLSKPVSCTIGKKASSIVSVSVENDTLYFTADNKARKANDVYFSTKTCAEVLDNMENAKSNDVQPVSDEERYAQNAAEGIVRTMNNNSIQSVTFTDSIATIFTNPKDKKQVKAEIVGLRRTDNGTIYCCFELANGKLYRFELLKSAAAFNKGTLNTIQKQINDGKAKKKNANARLEFMASSAA